VIIVCNTFPSVTENRHKSGEKICDTVKSGRQFPMFRRNVCLQLQSRRLFVLPRSCRHQRRYIHATLHDVARKINVSIATSVARNSAPRAVHRLSQFTTPKRYTPLHNRNKCLLSVLSKHGYEVAKFYKSIFILGPNGYSVRHLTMPQNLFLWRSQYWPLTYTTLAKRLHSRGQRQ
jgi:hypothetical protein